DGQAAVLVTTSKCRETEGVGLVATSGCVTVMGGCTQRGGCEGVRGPQGLLFLATSSCTAVWRSQLSCRSLDIFSIRSVSTSLTACAASRHCSSLSLCKPTLKAPCSASSGF